MPHINVDPHAHLYDSYDVPTWCAAAIRSLGSDGAVIIVDRLGQDSVARLGAEVPRFAAWKPIPGGGVVTTTAGERLLVIRGVQYVAEEGIEVLGLGVIRARGDGAPAQELINGIAQAGGVPCLPWSPGKWLGKRGVVVRRLLDTHAPTQLVVGDIAIRSCCGPFSLLLNYAKRRGFTVLCGTDPLPRKEDEVLVGAFGMKLSGQVPSDVESCVPWILKQLASGSGASPVGKRNNPLKAAVRFISSIKK